MSRRFMAGNLLPASWWRNRNQWRNTLSKWRASTYKGRANVPVTGVREIWLGLQEPGPVSNFALKEVINATCAMVTWDPVDPATVPGELIHYGISYGHERHEYNWTNYVKVEPTASQAVICGLEPNRVNYANILAINQQYWGPRTDLINIPMPEAVPDDIVQVVCHIHGSSSMVLFMVPHSEPSDIGYNVYLTPNNSSNTTKFLVPTGNRLKINHLTPFTEYIIEVEPYNKAGVGKSSEARRCITGSKPEDPSKASQSPCLLNGACDKRKLVPVVKDMRDSQEDPSKVDIDFVLPYLTDLPSPREQRVYVKDYISGWQGFKEWKTWFSAWFLQYRKKSEVDWTSSEVEMDEFETTITLEADTVYEFRAVFADAGYTVASPADRVTTDTASLFSFALFRMKGFAGEVFQNLG